MDIVLYTSAFCAPCASARATLTHVKRLVPSLTSTERDVVRFDEDAAADGIRSTPTFILRSDAGDELFRAEGAPRLDQLLTAVAQHIDLPR